MSKKNKKPLIQTTGGVALSHEAEYRIIKFDLIKVLALNLVYLAIILGLYFANRSSGFLDNWFAKVLHF